jgi:hypothetical protein
MHTWACCLVICTVPECLQKCGSRIQSSGAHQGCRETVQGPKTQKKRRNPRLSAGGNLKQSVLCGGISPPPPHGVVVPGTSDLQWDGIVLVTFEKLPRF